MAKFLVKFVKKYFKILNNGLNISTRFILTKEKRSRRLLIQRATPKDILIDI